MSRRNLQKAFNRFDSIKKRKDPEVPAILGFTVNGINTVEVGNRSGFVWARIRNNQNEVVQAFNDQVSPVYGLPVILVRDEVDRVRYKIKGKDLGVYQNWNNTPYLPRHGNQHSFNPEAGGGGDVVFVYNRQFMPLSVHPSGSAGGGNVYVQPYAYYQNTQWKYAGGTGTANVIAYKPTGSSARMVLVYLDSDGNPQLSPGSTYFNSSITGNAAVLPYIPSLGGSADIPLAAVRLVSGTNNIVWDNIYDLRPIIVSDGFIPTGTMGHIIQDDGTPLAQQSALNFIGSAFSIYNAGGATNVSGTFVSGGILERSIPVYDDGVFKTTGTVLNFTDNITVVASGSVAFISSTGGGGGIPERSLPIFDNSVFKITGTAINFTDNLDVVVSGSVAHVYIPAGTFASGSHTHPAGATAIQIFDDSVFKATGTAISFDSNLTVSVSGTVAYVSSTGGGGSGTVYSAWDADAPPASPDALDDEFNDLSFSGWSEFDPNSILTVTETIRGARLSCVTRAGVNLVGVYKSIPAGDFTIAAKIRAQLILGSYQLYGLGLWESATGTSGGIVGIQRQTQLSNAIDISLYANHNSYTSSYAVRTLGYGVTTFYLRIRRTGTTYSFDFSSDGASWEQVFSGAIAFVPQHFGITIDNEGSGQTIITDTQFFRYKSSDVGIAGALEGQTIWR